MAAGIVIKPHGDAVFPADLLGITRARSPGDSSAQAVVEITIVKQSHLANAEFVVRTN
jgi:hypothetical protein